MDALSPDVRPPEPGDDALCCLSRPIAQPVTAGVYRCPEYDMQAQKWGPGATCSQWERLASDAYKEEGLWGETDEQSRTLHASCPAGVPASDFRSQRALI